MSTIGRKFGATVAKLHHIAPHNTMVRLYPETLFTMGPNYAIVLVLELYPLLGDSMNDQPKHPNFAQLFASAFATFEQAIHPIPPSPDSIIRLAIAADKMVQFHLNEALAVTFVFSDGSRAVLDPAQLTTH